jgi:ABC-type amino acid transport substrate-binding protein
MKTRILNLTATAFATALAVATLSSCSTSDAPEVKNDLRTVKSGELKLAFRSDDKPFSFVEKGKPTGFDVELMQAVAKEMDQKVSFVSVDFASAVPNVRTHMYDTVADSTILVTDERKEMVNFTTNIGYGRAQLISPKSAPLQTVDEANGKQIAITRGSALIPLLQKKEPDVNIKEFPNIPASVNALKAGQVDGMFTGESTTAQLLAEHSDLTASQKIISGAQALPVAKDRPELKTALDAAIKKVMSNGTYTRLFDKWIPKGIAIPDQLLEDYPGLAQRPGASK